MTCPTGKRCYRSENEAKRAMRRLGERLRIYRCQKCRQLHITHERVWR